METRGQVATAFRGVAWRGVAWRGAYSPLRPRKPAAAAPYVIAARAPLKNVSINPPAGRTTARQA